MPPAPPPAPATPIGIPTTPLLPHGAGVASSTSREVAEFLVQTQQSFTAPDNKNGGEHYDGSGDLKNPADVTYAGTRDRETGKGSEAYLETDEGSGRTFQKEEEGQLMDVVSGNGAPESDGNKPTNVEAPNSKLPLRLLTIAAATFGW